MKRLIGKFSGWVILVLGIVSLVISMASAVNGKVIIPFFIASLLMIGVGIKLLTHKQVKEVSKR